MDTSRFSSELKHVIEIKLLFPPQTLDEIMNNNSKFVLQCANKKRFTHTEVMQRNYKMIIRNLLKILRGNNYIEIKIVWK